MSLHSHSNKEVRKRKYAEQFPKTLENKARKAKKHQEKLEKRKLKRESK